MKRLISFEAFWNICMEMFKEVCRKSFLKSRLKIFVMKKIVQQFSLLFIVLVISTSCKKTHEGGCTDGKALNKKSSAEVDDGSCNYSKIIFYMSVINPARPVTVTVGGNNIGTITSQFPGGPGNCSAPGCAVYQFKGSQKLDWVATEPGGSIWTGTIEPNSSSDCIKVRVY